MRKLTKAILRRLRDVARPYLRAYGLVGAASVFGRSLVVFEPDRGNVLVLAPHMDDETLGCGGALVRHASAGARIAVVYLSDGSRGSSSLGAYHGEERRARELALAAARKREARKACELLGIERIEFLDGPDGDLASAEDLVPRLRDILREFRPDLVYLPFFLEEHPDHRAASRWFIDAAVLSGLDCQCMAYEVWTPLIPNCVVQIDLAIETKKRAIECYRSQLEGCDYLHKIVGLNAYRSVTLSSTDARFAECYLSARLSDYRRLYEASAMETTQTP